MTGLELGLAAGIPAAATFLSSLLGLGAQREAEKRSALQQGASGVYEMTQSSLGQQQQATQTALGDLIAAYRSNLGA
jgi:hypothetical protein